MPLFDGVHLVRAGQSSSWQQTCAHLRSSGSQKPVAHVRCSLHEVPSAVPPVGGGTHHFSGSEPAWP